MTYVIACKSLPWKLLPVCTPPLVFLSVGIPLAKSPPIPGNGPTFKQEQFFLFRYSQVYIFYKNIIYGPWRKMGNINSVEVLKEKAPVMLKKNWLFGEVWGNIKLHYILSGYQNNPKWLKNVTHVHLGTPCNLRDISLKLHGYSL